MKVPIREEELLVLKGASEFDLDLLMAAVEPFGLEPYIGTRFALIQSELRHLVENKGVSYVWRLARQTEAVLPCTEDKAAIVTLLARMLNQLSPTQDFVIVDRFLLPKSRPSDYLDTLVSILTPIVRTVCCLTLVTSSKFVPQLLDDLVVRITLLGSECQIVHRTSDIFHDRFWIADRQRGLFVGTSLNGIGRRYALVDYMRERDVRHIIKVLVSEGLL